ncbi:12495_t:CDS:2, partial [Gigaspora margarita]
KEQEIVEILKKFKNRVLKKNKVVTKYLGVQHQTSLEEIELLELNKNTNQPNKVINQAQIAKDMLLQLKCARELQEEIVRINGTTHLLERESPTDIKMLEKEEVSSIITDFTNEVE